MKTVSSDIPGREVRNLSRSIRSGFRHSCTVPSAPGWESCIRDETAADLTLSVQSKEHRWRLHGDSICWGVILLLVIAAGTFWALMILRLGDNRLRRLVCSNAVAVGLLTQARL